MPSTVIKEISYEPESKCLKIRFVSGLLYEYANVPPEVYNQFIAYREKGIFFNKFIRKNYDSKKVESA